MYREPINPISEKEKIAVLALTKWFSDFWTILDIGSNKGLWTDLLLSERESSNKHENIKVYMFEPNKLLLDYCRVKYEHTNKIEFINDALGSEFEYRDFYYFEDNHSGISNFIGNWKELNPKINRIPVKRLDSFTFDREIDILKVDCEGFDLEVLRGAESLLRDKKIKFLQVECSPHNKDVKFQDIVQYLEQFGYKCWDYKDEQFIPINTFSEDIIDNFYFTYMNISKGSRDHIKLHYTQLWNGEFIKNTQFLKKKVEFALEIGSYQGLTSNYICDELLVDKQNCRLICVDPLREFYTENWMDEEHLAMFRGQYEIFINNTQEQPIELIRKKSEDAYEELNNYLFDMIFLDGDHAPEIVYKDAVFAINHLKLGGHIILDDYGWHDTHIGIDKFLKEYEDVITILHKDYQVVVKKIANIPTWEQEFDVSRIHAAYTNLDVRGDRNEKMISEIEKVKPLLNIQRQRSYPWKELWDNFSKEEKQRNMVMYKRTKGAIGCHHSQVNIMKTALEQDKIAIVLEDDLIFCDDIKERLQIIYKFLHGREWDIFWFGGTYHREEGGIWHKLDQNGNHVHPDLKMCKCKFGTDYLPTEHPNIVQTIGAFSTHAYMVNRKSIQKVLDALDKDLHLSMGIDWLMLLHQPEWKTFAFVPGCIKQYNSQSNISNGLANQEAFRNLGKHWWSRKMDEYIPD